MLPGAASPDGERPVRGEQRTDQIDGGRANGVAIGGHLDDAADRSDSEHTPKDPDRPGRVLGLDVQVAVIGPEAARLAGGEEQLEHVVRERPLELAPDRRRFERELAVANEQQGGHEEPL